MDVGVSRFRRGRTVVNVIYIFSLRFSTNRQVKILSKQPIIECEVQKEDQAKDINQGSLACTCI